MRLILKASLRLRHIVAASSATVFLAIPSAAAVECQTVPSAILNRQVSVCVALPPDYSSSKARFPSLYFLHGLFENERSWEERGGLRILEELWAHGDAGRFIVILPDGGKTFYINSYDGHERYEDFFIRELVPWVDKQFRTIQSPTSRGISGTSMGGYGALHLAMDHPDVFGSVSAHSAALIPGIPDPVPSTGRWGFYARVLQTSGGLPWNREYFDLNHPLTLAEHPDRFKYLKVYFDCGESDRYGFEAGAELLHERLQGAGFSHEFALRPGGHGWSYLNQYLKFSIEFHWRCFSKAASRSLAAAGEIR